MPRSDIMLAPQFVVGYFKNAKLRMKSTPNKIPDRSKGGSTLDKIAFVIPWYGEDDPEGIEMELRQLVSHLQRAGTDLEILTTCIRNYQSDWNQNYYAAGVSLVDDIQVRRFPAYQRNLTTYVEIRKKLEMGAHLSQNEERTYIEETINSPLLYEYLEDAVDDHDLLVFLPYSYGTTFAGMQIAPKKSVLIPCFQDEPSLRLRLFRQTYIHAAGLIYHTRPEMDLAGRVYDFSTPAQICMGVGVNTGITADAARFREKYQIDAPYLLYAGRKDRGKNLPLLLRYFLEYCRRNMDTPLELVLLGTGRVDIPAGIADKVHDLGFVPEEDKYDAMAGAVALCQPSLKERFSPVLMESWLCGSPVLVSANCPVTREHARRANGGLYYRDFFEFEGSVDFFLQNPNTANAMAQNGKAFVEKHFSWEKIVADYQNFFASLRER